jgi:hypothetical protein
MAMFGWCITKHHSQCLDNFDWNGNVYQCSCSCHEKGEKDAK